jgi:hypothetical protein
VRYDSSNNLEFVVLTAVSGSTITGNFLASHAAGVPVSAGTKGDGSLWFPGYAHDDPGCLGLDADDRDSTVHTGAQGIAKYGSLPLFLAKLGRDWQTLENDTAADQIGSAGQAAAAAALLTNTAHTYWLAPAIPSASCTGTAAQCTGAAYPINSCVSINSPCLTVSNLISAGYSNTGAGGDLIIARDGWNSPTTITMYGGSSTRYNGFWSYPGEHAVLTAALKLGPPSSCSNPTYTNYVWVDGMRLESTSTQFGGAIIGGSCDNSSPGQNHDVVITHNNGTESDSGGLAPLTGFDYLNNWTIAYNTFHDDNCPSGCNTPHGIYLGDHQSTSTNLTLRRNLIFRNSFNGLHWNGQATGFYIDQNVVYDNGIAGLDFSSGIVNSYLRSNVVFNNAKEIVFELYPGNCPAQTGYAGPPLYLCPGNITGNLIENNTIYHTGNANITSPGSNPDAGCPSGINYCQKWGIAFFNSTSPLVGSLGGNTLRNNVITSYGNGNSAVAVPVIYYEPNGSSAMCDATCLGWPASTTFDHNLFWQTDGKGGSNVIWANADYTVATAGSVTSAFTSNRVGDPGFVNEAIQEWSVESYFDFRPLPGSATLHAGSAAGIPNYDAGGRAFVEVTPSIGAREQNLYANGWNTLANAGFVQAAAPANGAPTDLLGAAITSTSATTITATNAAEYARGNLIGIDSELMCISAISGTTITIGVYPGCSGTPSANGRGWAGTAAATHSNGATVYLGTLSSINSCAQGTSPSTYYPYQGEWSQAFTTWSDGFLRDAPGRPKQLFFTGGGHNNTNDNSLYYISFNQATPTIGSFGLSAYSAIDPYAGTAYDAVGACGQPSVDPSTGRVNAQSAEMKDGAPAAVHAQGVFAYNPITDSIGKFGGGYAGANGPHNYDSFIYSFSSGWSRYNSITDQSLTAPGTHDVDCRNYGTGYSSCGNGLTVGQQVDPIAVYNGSGFGGANIYDPLTQTFWVYWNASGNNSIITEYFPSIHQHVVRATGQFGPLQNGSSNPLGASRVFVSDLRRWYIENWDGTTVTVFYYDLTGWTSTVPIASSTALTSHSVAVDSSCNTLFQNGGPGLSYVPSIARIVGFPAGSGGNTYYLIDPTASTWVCTAVTQPGGPPTSPTNLWISGKQQYSPSTDWILLWNDIGANVPRVLNLGVGDPGVQAGGATQTGSTPPSISIATPANGSTVSGSVTISASVSAPAGIASIQFKLDGSNLGAAGNATPYSISWSTAGVANGSHTLTAVIVDLAGNSVTSAAVSVSVNNASPPTISITSPASGASLQGTVSISATATPGSLAIASVQFKVDGVNSGPVVPLSPYLISLATAGLTNGSHTISAIAVDTAGNTGASSGVIVTVNNPTNANSNGLPPTQGLTGYWNLNEDSGTIAHDSSGSGYNGTVTGAPWVTGYIGSALSFNGGTYEVVTSTIQEAGPVSISAWVNAATTTQIGFGRIAETEYTRGFYLGTDSTGTHYKFIVNSGSGSTGSCGASFGCAQGGTVSTGWHLITGTYDGTTATLYVDNSVVATDTFTAPASASFPLYIGHFFNGGGYGWNGVIDEVRLYNRALSATEVTTIYGYNGAASNLPVVSLTSPAANGTISSTVSVAATATAAGTATIASLQFQLDGSNLGPALTTAPYTTSWNTSTAMNGTHSLTATATDSSGNTGSSVPLIVTVDNTTAEVSVSACDLNGDGVVNNLDVQIAINQALGTTGCTNASLQQNGQCNVIDVQRVVNASLGGACKLGQ